MPSIFCLGPLSTTLRQKRNYFPMFHIYLLYILNQSAGTVSQSYKGPQWGGVASVCRRPLSQGRLNGRYRNWRTTDQWDTGALEAVRKEEYVIKRFENAHRVFKIYCYCFENVLAVLYSLTWNIYMNQVFAKELTLGRFFMDLFLNGVSFSVISLVSFLLLDNRIWQDSWLYLLSK